MTKAMGDREYDTVVLTAAHGPSGSEVSCWRMDPDAGQPLALYLGSILGTLG